MPDDIFSVHRRTRVESNIQQVCSLTACRACSGSRKRCPVSKL